MESMFSTLLQLPLFQGLCQEDFTSILGKVKLHFTKHKHGEVIARGKDTCDKLIFLLKGEITVVTRSESESLIFLESYNEPYLIEPHSLFGLDTIYRSTYIARSEVNVLSIDKSYVIKELLKYEIFRINYINAISNRSQTLHKRLWEPKPNKIRDKIIHFILIHAERPEGEKILKIRMDDLARNLNDTRLNVSKALNEFQEEGLIILRRKEILVPEASLLMRELS